MTREQRETDMEDYVRYLDQIHHHLSPLPGPELLLGFSQGVATAARWACRGRARFDALIYWSGVFPPDLDLESEWPRMRGVRTYIALGDDDAFFDDALIQRTQAAFESNGIAHEVIRFSGGHTVDSEALSLVLGRFV
jgi:predicted esterase